MHSPALPHKTSAPLSFNLTLNSVASVKLIGLARTVTERTKLMAKVVIVLAAVLQLADALTEPDCPVMQGETLQNHIFLSH